MTVRKVLPFKVVSRCQILSWRVFQSKLRTFQLGKFRTRVGQVEPYKVQSPIEELQSFLIALSGGPEHVPSRPLPLGLRAATGTTLFEHETPEGSKSSLLPRQQKNLNPELQAFAIQWADKLADTEALTELAVAAFELWFPFRDIPGKGVIRSAAFEILELLSKADSIAAQDMLKASYHLRFQKKFRKNTKPI